MRIAVQDDKNLFVFKRDTKICYLSKWLAERKERYHTKVEKDVVTIFQSIC